MSSKHGRILTRGTVLAGCVATWSTAALAQAALPRVPPLPPTIPQQSPAPQPSPPAPTVAPFDAPLDRLAEILGTLSYMRDLCGEGDGTAWRDKMQALIDSEGRTSPRVARLAGSFNRGFKGYQLTYRTCTASAQAVIGRSLDEGARIAKDLSVQFSVE